MPKQFLDSYKITFAESRTQFLTMTGQNGYRGPKFESQNSALLLSVAPCYFYGQNCLRFVYFHSSNWSRVKIVNIGVWPDVSHIYPSYSSENSENR